MVTASHNPPAYNGYKVYWGNGAQIIPPHDAGIAAAIAKIGRSDELAMPELDELRRSRPRRSISTRRSTTPTSRQVVALRASPDARWHARWSSRTRRCTASARRPSSPRSQRAGFPQVHTEPSQREPDPEFPTVAFPNPEEKGAMDRVLALAARGRAPTSCSPTIPTPIGCASRSPRAPATACSPAIRSARCSPTTCSRSARRTSAWSRPRSCRRSCSASSRSRPAPTTARR